MIEEQLSERIALDSIIVTDRTRKEFGDISSLVDSISSVGLLQPLVINENNELVDDRQKECQVRTISER